MANYASPSALIHVEAEPEHCKICSVPVSWTHPCLRRRLLQLGGMGLVVLLLAALEFSGQLVTPLPGLFPGLLSVSTVLQGIGLQHIRQHTLYIQINRTQIQLWEGPWGHFQPDQAQTIAWQSVETLEVIQGRSGHSRRQPLLCFRRLAPHVPLTVGAGLPQADLLWLREFLNHWRTHTEKL